MATAEKLRSSLHTARDSHQVVPIEWTKLRETSAELRRLSCILAKFPYGKYGPRKRQIPGWTYAIPSDHQGLAEQAESIMENLLAGPFHLGSAVSGEGQSVAFEQMPLPAPTSQGIR